MLSNDFIDLLGSSHLISNYEKFFVYENILMKCALFTEFCVIIFVVFLSQLFCSTLFIVVVFMIIKVLVLL
jgi:hypothetical protein